VAPGHGGGGGEEGRGTDPATTTSGVFAAKRCKERAILLAHVCPFVCNSSRNVKRIFHEI
jgi:hypothetical protein